LQNVLHKNYAFERNNAQFFVNTFNQRR